MDNTLKLREGEIEEKGRIINKNVADKRWNSLLLQLTAEWNILFSAHKTTKSIFSDNEGFFSLSH